MSSKIEELMEELNSIKNTPDQIMSEDDKLISQIIKIEKKHLHGLEGSSEKSRREEIERLVRERVKQRSAVK